MRKYLLFTLLLALVAGCSKNNDSDPENPRNPEITLNVSAAPIEFPVEGGSRDVTVTTNATSWDVESNQAWCRVTKEAGKFIVSASANASTAPPAPATVTVTASGTTKSVSIVVTQAAALMPSGPYIKATIDTVYFREDGGSAGIGISTNQKEWGVNSDQTWCVVTKLDEGISIDITEYWTGSTPRTANITLTAGEATFKLVVIQDPAADLYITSSQGNAGVLFPHNGGNIVVYVTTNVSKWSVWVDKDWVRVKVINNMSFSITADANTSGAARPKTEVIIQANGRTHKLSVEQEDPISSGNDYEYGDPTKWD